jgi:hypothetical protein
LFDHFIAVALCSRANRQFTPLTAQEIKALIGKKRRRTGR